MENQYDVGVTNRYALFLEEGENDLPIIKKKLSKELRTKNKLEKKVNAEAKKVEAIKATGEKVKETTQPKKDVKEAKSEGPKNKERKPKNESIKRDQDLQNMQSNVIDSGDSAPPAVDSLNAEVTKSDGIATSTRKNYENRKPRDRKYDRGQQHDQPNHKNYPNPQKYNKDDSSRNIETGTNDILVNGANDSNAQESGNYQPHHQNDYKSRGGSRYRGSGRGGRGNYGGGDRRKNYNDNRQENNEDADNNKSDTWNNDEKPENVVENSDNQNEDLKPDENDSSSNHEQKEAVKELLTLDEWKKLRGQREKPQYNVRKAGEGEDLSQWKNMREFQREKETDFLKNGSGSHHSGLKKNEDKENGSSENAQRGLRQKILDINYHFKEPAVRGSRGGRAMRNIKIGYRGRNDDRYGRNRDGLGGAREAGRQHAPKITDEHDFPSLG